MKIQYVITFFAIIAVTLQNCNCGKGGAANVEGLNQDSLRRADSMRQEFIKDSIKTDSINKKMGILYEEFVTKYDAKNKGHQVELGKWTSDPLFLALKKDENWVEKIEELEAIMSVKK